MAEFSTEQRSDLSRRGLAMPDGSFPIRNKSDLRNAISSYGRAKNPDAAKRWIIRRARELNALDMLPESWNVAQHSDILAHYGVKGMKWGVRRKRTSKNTYNKNYSDRQRKNDRALYGNRAEKRINRKMNEGYGIQGARHFEVERRDRRDRRNKLIKKGAKIAGSAAATLGSLYVSDQIFNGGAGTRTLINTGKILVGMLRYR